MKGYKIFDKDLTYDGIKFEIGKTYSGEDYHNYEDAEFVFYSKVQNCYWSNEFIPENRIVEIEAFDRIYDGDYEGIYYSNKIKLIREINWQDIIELVNTGIACTGHSNTGDHNSGNFNAGNYNYGDYNTGEDNSGDYNTGEKNAGDCNTGDDNRGNKNTGNDNDGNYNTGFGNSGNYNTGANNPGYNNAGNRNCGDLNTGNCNVSNKNTGDSNIGHKNTGNRNDGYANTGNNNKGHYNTGDYNIGEKNSGNHNFGDGNIGNWNNGDHNIGDFNKTYYAMGCFNTQEQKLKFFDVETDMTMEEWKNSKARKILSEIKFLPTEWVYLEDMTAEERKANPECIVTKGYLRRNNITDFYTEWWKNLTVSDKEIIKSTPNFDPEKFYKITGIKVE